MGDEELQLIIDRYTSSVIKKEMELDQLRPQLKALGVQESKIKKIVASVDDAVQRHDLQSLKRNRDFQFSSTGFGTVLSLLGVVYIFLDYLGVEALQNSNLEGFLLLLGGFSIILIRKVKVRTSKFRNKDKFINGK